MSFHLNRPVKSFFSEGMRARASSTSAAEKILRHSQTPDSPVVGSAYQLGFIRAGSWGMAKIVQTAQGNEMHPQILWGHQLASPRRTTGWDRSHVHPSPSRPAVDSVETCVDGGPDLLVTSH